MRPPINRVEPRLPIGAVRSWEIRAPKDTHWRAATCAEIDCGAYLHGWRTTVDERTELGQGQAYYIRKQSGRKYTEARNGSGVTVFTFEAGQRCFKADDHQMRIERPEIYVVRDGDHRGNPRGWVRRHNSPADWVDDFAEHQDKLADRMREG